MNIALYAGLAVLIVLAGVIVFILLKKNSGTRGLLRAKQEA